MIKHLHFTVRTTGALLGAFLAVAALTTVAPAALGLNVGYYEMCSGAGESWHVPPITTAGHTAVLLNDLSTSDLAGVDVIFVTNCDNGGYGAEYTSRLADIDSAVSAGKILVIHDRFVDPAETILPGGAAFTIVRDFSDDANIDVLDNSTLVTNGPGGVVDNLNLDGGCSSTHGFALGGTLPLGAKLLLSRTNPNEIVTFAYTYGGGQVIYSSIPLDFYLDGGPCQPNLATIYAPNVVAYAASLFCVDPTDTDGDGRGDSCDNCVAVPNPDQRDCDIDGEGDACDPDTPDGDADQVADDCDNCPSNANSTQDDSDIDGFGDACDDCVGPGLDSDGDVLCDGADPCPADPTQACATLFGCTGTGGSPSTLYRINPATGVGYAVGPMLGVVGCSGLDFDPTTDVLYAVGSDNLSFQNSLFVVDPSTGAATVVGATGQATANDISFRSDGQLFSYHRLAVAAGTVSTTTGQATLLGSSGLFGGGNGITFEQNDDLLHADNLSLSLIDQTTGAATILAPLAFPSVPCGFPRINSMDTHASGIVYGVMNCGGGPSSPNYLVTIALPSGSVNAIAPSVTALDGIAFAPQGVCGDGMPDFGEQCDDGNNSDGDCCSSTCTYETAGEPCAGDGSLCTIDQCDGAGTCVSTPPTTCKQPGKSLLLLKKKANTASDKLVFKWLKGALTAPSEFGDPTSTAAYALCLYTGPAGNPFLDVTVPAGAMKWSPVSTKGYKYKDPQATADGVTKVLLKGGDAGKSKTLVKGKGAALLLPNFANLPLPVTAQLVNSETNACFEATYDLADLKKNDGGQFKAKTQ